MTVAKAKGDNDVGQGIFVGKNSNGKRVYIPEETRFTHLHIIGSSGEGKSKFMEHLIREDIIADQGLCLIDPHGYLYHDIVRWCETKQMLDRRRPKKIILFNPSEEHWAFGFNPLQTATGELSFHVDAMVNVCAKVWGGEDTDRTPLLKRCLRVLFHALAEKQLSLLESSLIVNPAEEQVRKYLTKGIQDHIIQGQWNAFNELGIKQFEEKFSSTVNRMMEFLASPIIRATIGQIGHSIDFRKIMDEGWVLLVNLATTDRVSRYNAKLLGTLIFNDLFIKALGRPKHSRPFYLYIDECAQFINEDIGHILDEGRKFGLHQILAHQHLSQLQEAGNKIYQAVMTDAKTKVIFGGLSADDARELAEQIFLGELDLEEAKESLSKPVVVGYIKTWLDNYSQGRSTTSGDSWGSSSGETSGTSNSQAESVTPSQHFLGEDHVVTTTGQSRSSTASSSYSSGGSHAETASESHGRSETFIPVLEERPSQVFSLEEQIYKGMAVLVNQRSRHAILKLPKQHTQVIQTPFIEPGYANPKRVENFKNRCYRLSGIARPRVEVDLELAQRRERLLEEARLDRLGPPEPADFREAADFIDVGADDPDDFRS